jgi:hypothetical protein
VVAIIMVVDSSTTLLSEWISVVVDYLAPFGAHMEKSHPNCQVCLPSPTHHSIIPDCVSIFGDRMG